MVNKVIFILPYFGELPNYFPLWLNSAKYNFSYDFLFITDTDIDKYDLPNNVKYKKTTFDQLVIRVKSCFPFPVSISSHYKICDYKPAYGLIFNDEIRGYSHWGYCDIDLTLGNLNHFINEEMLVSGEKIGIFAHLIILPNTKKINNLMLQDDIWPVDIHKALISSKLFNLAEAGGINQVFSRNNWQQRALPIADIIYDDAVVRSRVCKALYQIHYYHCDKTFCLYMDTVGEKQVEREIAYIHYQKRKMALDNNLDYAQPIIYQQNIVTNFQLEDSYGILKTTEDSELRRRLHGYKRKALAATGYVIGFSKYDIRSKRRQSIQNIKDHNMSSYAFYSTLNN
ncbi:hypothetical protein AGMMS49992_23590 [Clostridia bacterium]|nr:hypothetical protein AGMMS49992_23590 [Clostridia bacterium]